MKRNNDDIIIVNIPKWQDEIGKLINDRQFIGNATIYLSENCYNDLKKEITEKRSNSKSNMEVLKNKQNILSITVCNNNIIKLTLYRVEEIQAFEFHYQNRGSRDKRIFLFKKSNESIGEYQ